MADKHYVVAVASQLATMFANSGATVHEEVNDDDKSWFVMTDPTDTETLKITVEAHRA